VGITVRALASVSDEVTLPQLRTLVVVSLQGPQTVSALAERLDVHASTMTRMCNRLVTRSLVARKPSALDAPDVPLDIVGTAFQWKVWKALTEIPPGETRTYGEIAKRIGEPTSARAVGRACATNQAAGVIPCHRAVGANGSITGYRWGVTRKERLLAAERSRRAA